MNTLTRQTFVDALKTALPDFNVNPDWSEDNLGFPIINDLAREICRNAEIDSETVQRALGFLEKCLEEGDSYVRDLVHECLERLLCCPEIGQIRPKFGPLLKGYVARLLR